jgi:hypothetical protein
MRWARCPDLAISTTFCPESADDVNGPTVRILQCYFQNFDPEIGDVRVFAGFDEDSFVKSIVDVDDTRGYRLLEGFSGPSHERGRSRPLTSRLQLSERSAKEGRDARGGSRVRSDHRMYSDIDGGDHRRVCFSQGEHGSLIASEGAAFPPNQPACRRLME